MKSSLIREINYFETYNELLKSFLDTYNKNFVNSIHIDIKNIETIRINYFRYFVPFFNYKFLKNDFNSHKNNFKNKKIIEYLFACHTRKLRRYNILFILALTFLIIPIVCVWSFLDVDLRPISIAVSVIIPILFLMLFINPFILFKYDIGKCHLYSTSDLFQQELRRISYSWYLIIFKYFYRKRQIGINILEKNNLVLKLINGDEYRFNNFMDLIKKINEIEPNLLYLKDDEKIYKTEDEIKKNCDRQLWKDISKYRINKDSTLNNFEELFIFSNDHSFNYKNVENWFEKTYKYNYLIIPFLNK